MKNLVPEWPSQAFSLNHTQWESPVTWDNKEKGPGAPRTSSLEATTGEVEKDSIAHGFIIA